MYFRKKLEVDMIFVFSVKREFYFEVYRFEIYRFLYYGYKIRLFYVKFCENIV